MILRRGDKNEGVRYVQELLALFGLNTTIDGEFGPATEALVKGLQVEHGVIPDGIVTPEMVAFAEKAVGLTDAQNPPDFVLAPTLGETMARLAKWHARFHPREVGGDNRGPWVRLYMSDTENLPWCAGFATYIMKQACRAGNFRQPIVGGWSCTKNAEQAMAAGILHTGEGLGDMPIPVGSMFVRRKRDHNKVFIPGAWEHTGIVVEDDIKNGVVKTIEGNTNDGGSREGIEVCMHTLQRDNRDYIFI
jgi:hypothetical protein